jgi:hypothetical protein
MPVWRGTHFPQWRPESFLQGRMQNPPYPVAPPWLSLWVLYNQGEMHDTARLLSIINFSYLQACRLLELACQFLFIEQSK